MSVFLVIPSARPPAEANLALKRWSAMGYKIALWCVEKSMHDHKICDVKLTGPDYPGWAGSINILAACVLRQDPDCQWIVTGGDDTWPDPNKRADEIAAECSGHFIELGSVQRRSCGCLTCRDRTATYGVMQPTGDRWGEGEWAPDKGSALIDRIAGSPWLGREWCLRINQGRGPMWPEYPHSWADEELQNVAQKYGVFWQRRDLTHYHNHPQRVEGGQRPDWLKWVDQDYHDKMGLFRERKNAGFPGSEPI